MVPFFLHAPPIAKVKEGEKEEVGEDEEVSKKGKEMSGKCWVYCHLLCLTKWID